MTWSAQQTKFYNEMWPLANEAGSKLGVDPAIIFAQSALETGWGKSAPQNNYFGIKGNGAAQTTREYINGAWVTIKDKFSGYTSMQDSVSGYVNFISSNKRYKSFLGADSTDDQIAALGASGYATDPDYAKKIASIVSGVKDAGGSVIGAITSGAGLSGPFAAAFEKAQEVATNAVDLVKSPVDGIKGWLEEFFSVNTAARAIAVVVGIILIGLAIYALISGSETVQKASRAAMLNA